MATAMETIEVPTYISDDEMTTDEPVVNGNNTTVKRRQRNWVKDMVFNNANEAEEAVVKENQWSHYYTNTTVEGKKQFFRCNKVKRRGVQCDAGIYLLFNSTNDEVILFRDKSDHTHDRVGTRDPKISNEVKEAIKDLFQLKLKPKAIIEALYVRGMAAPTIKQLNNFLTTLKSKTLGPTAISLGEIEQWCIEGSKTIPESDDTPFIVSYQIIYDNVMKMMIKT